eukprot:4940737-Pleurochrysis_carterae.AAC.4
MRSRCTRTGTRAPPPLSRLSQRALREALRRLGLPRTRHHAVALVHGHRLQEAYAKTQDVKFVIYAPSIWEKMRLWQGVTREERALAPWRSSGKRTSESHLQRVAHARAHILGPATSDVLRSAAATTAVRSRLRIIAARSS